MPSHSIPESPNATIVGIRPLEGAILTGPPALQQDQVAVFTVKQIGEVRVRILSAGTGFIGSTRINGASYSVWGDYHPNSSGKGELNLQVRTEKALSRRFLSAC